MPCPFTGPKMFCAGPNILSQPKDLTAFSASSKTNFTKFKSSFCLAQNVGNKFLVWHKKLGPAQRYYTYKPLQTIQMNRMLLWVLAEWAVLGRGKTALKFKDEI